MCLCVCILLYSSCNSILRSKGGHTLFFFFFLSLFYIIHPWQLLMLHGITLLCVCVYTQKRDRALFFFFFFFHSSIWFRFSLYILLSSFFVYASNWNLSFSALWCCGELFRLYTHTVKHPSLFFFYLFCVCIYVVICLFHAANKFSTMLLYLMIQLTGLWISDKRKFPKRVLTTTAQLYSICCLYLACIYYMHSRKYIYFPLILIHNNLISTRKSIVPFHISQIIQVYIWKMNNNWT